MKPVFILLSQLILWLPIMSWSAPAELLKHDRFLVVLAHPDDETWLNGTLALLADNKKHIRTVYATSGGAGNDYSNQGLSGTHLAKAREHECILAHEILGTNYPPVFFRHDDKHLTHSEAELTSNIQQHIKSFQPDALITFDQYGITGHKDHKLVSRLTSLIHKNLNDVDLYKVVISQSRSRVLHRVAEDLSHPYRIKHSLPDENISLTVNVKKYTKNRIGAFEQYPTQFPPDLQTLWKTFVHSSFVEEFIF